MARMALHLVVISGVASLVLFINLGSPRLWDRDEPRNAACAREMLERGDWVVPTFNGELRVLKPALKYWLMISAYKLFGINEFAARFWSAVFGIATVWATYFMGRRLFEPLTGFWSALILSTSLLFVAAGHLAKVDAPLTFFSTLALWVYVERAFKVEEGNPELAKHGPGASFVTPFSQSWLVALLVYTAVGLAALAKGLPGVLPAAVIGMFLLIVLLPRPTPDRGGAQWVRILSGSLRPFAPLHFLRTFWLMRPLTAVVVTLAVAAPWYVLVALYTDGEFLRGFFLEHHLQRALHPMEDHSGPFLLYYLATIAGGFFPWSVFLIPLVVWLVSQFRQGDSSRMACLFCLCWVGVYVVIFSLASTKLPGYITPCFPALSLLMGHFMCRLSAAEKVPALWTIWGVVVLGGAGLAGTFGYVVVARLLLPGEECLGLIGLILVFGAVAAFILLQQRRLRAASVSLLVTAIAFQTTVFGVGLVRLGGNEGQRALCAAITRHANNPRLGGFGSLEPSWVFYAQRAIQPLTLKPLPELPPNPWKARPIQAAEFLGQGGDRLIITNDVDWQRLQPTLPADVRILAESPSGRGKGRWLLIGHPPATQDLVNAE